MVLKLAFAGAMALAYRARTSGERLGKAFVGADIRALDLQPAPIEPSWIISGNPRARAASHSASADKCSATSLWDCTAGSFRWFFGWDETVVILEGSVHVTAEDGSEQVLRAGDVGYFRAGTWSTWRVDDYVRKIAFVRQPVPTPIALYYRVRNRLLRARPAALAA
jgi:uncharacterized cupin superfamily protein